jgi:flagellin-like hook-associated protein FlgL
MTDGITLTASIRSNLLSLNNASALLATTSERLSTGKKVNGALDNPSSFFTARGLTNRASDLTSRKDGLGQAISLLQATDKSINSITSLIEQAKATAQSAEEASSAGISAISSVKGSFVAEGETGVTQLQTKAQLLTTTNAASTRTIKLEGNAASAYVGASNMIQFSGVSGLDSGDTITFTTSHSTAISDVATINGADTLTTMVAKLNDLDGISAIITGNDVVMTASGGVTLTVADDGINIAFTNGMKGEKIATNGGATTAILTGVGVVVDRLGDGTDLATTAFALTKASTASAIVINGVSTAIVGANLLSVDEYAQVLTSAHADISAAVDTTTGKIKISAENGTLMNFGNTDTHTELAFTQSAGTVTAAVSTDFAFDDGTAIAATDLLQTAFTGTAVSDTLQFGISGGSTGTAFTITAASTIQDLVDAINASDSGFVSTFNTTTEKIDITAADGTIATITQGGTSGAFDAIAFTTSAAALMTTGTAVTYGAAGSAAEVGTLNSDFQSILEQIDKLITDATYKGNNLLKGSNDSIVKFNEDGSSSITVTGLDLGVTSKTGLEFTLDADGYDFTASGGITQALTDTAAAITSLRSISATFGADMGVIQTRETFTSELVNVLESGAGKLVNANLEEESANMLALQTRQALGIQALSISNQSNQSILSLFR